MIRVAVTGYLGRMGSEVVRAVTAEADMEVVAAIDIELGCLVVLIQDQHLAEFGFCILPSIHQQSAAAAAVAVA